MKPRRMETGQSGSGSSHLFFLIQRREQIDFSQKVVCDSDSAEEIVMGSEVLRIASPRVFEGEFMSHRSFHPSQEETFDCLIE